MMQPVDRQKADAAERLWLRRKLWAVGREAARYRRPEIKKTSPKQMISSLRYRRSRPSAARRP
jgi:hypothetical protein